MEVGMEMAEVGRWVWLEMAEVLTHSQVVQCASYAVRLAAHAGSDTTGFTSPGAERGRKITFWCVAPPPRTDSSSKLGDCAQGLRLKLVSFCTACRSVLQDMSI